MFLSDLSQGLSKNYSVMRTLTRHCKSITFIKASPGNPDRFELNTHGKIVGKKRAFVNVTFPNMADLQKTKAFLFFFSEREKGMKEGRERNCLHFGHLTH